MKKTIVTVLVFFCGATSVLAQALTPEEARAIAKEAYIYGFPLVDNSSALLARTDKSASCSERRFVICFLLRQR
jgi:hypothetical protein